MPADDSVEYVDEVARFVIDVRRGLDYVETRSDLDARHIAFLSPSGGTYKLIPPAVDPRYRAIILQGAGIRARELSVHKDANPIHFAPLLGGPKIVIHGVHDEVILLKTEAEPLYNLLQSPKEFVRYKGGHRADRSYCAQLVNAWLDERFGPVKPKLPVQ
jgi:hypothetical protein